MKGEIQTNTLPELLVKKTRLPWSAVTGICAFLLLVILVLTALAEDKPITQLGWGFWRVGLQGPAILIYILSIYPVLNSVGNKAIESILALLVLDKNEVKQLISKYRSPRRSRELLSLLLGAGFIVLLSQPWNQAAEDFRLTGRAAHVTLAHRSDRFRAHDATVVEVRKAAEAGMVDIFTFHELHDVVGEGDRLAGIVLRETKTKATREVPCDVVLPMLGYVSDLGELTKWGLTLEKDEIVVNSQMETGRPGIYAAGDVTTYPGKLKLIAAGFGEAATAVNQAVHWVHPEKKVNPGHSSNLAVFGQKDD